MSAEFYVHNLGCKVNRVESDTISARLSAAGGVRASRSEAKVILINTCTVTGEADAKTRKAVRKALAEAGRPRVIATGCAVAIDAEALASLDERVIAEPDRGAAADRALALLGLAESGEERLRIGGGFNTRMGIKIQDGCDNACSYCIVHLARGSARSVAARDVLDQVRAAEEAGVREIVLTGVNIGAYTAPADSAGARTAGLARLIDDILGHTTDLRIRLSSLEPQHATDELLERMATSGGRVCAHLHLPLQSGCNTTLAAMDRHYDTTFFAERVARARLLMPRIALTTDLIVGFPGESDSDFEQSLDFCKSMAFSRMHVFRYSKRPGTPAAALPGQLDATIKVERSESARRIAEQLQLDDLITRIGTTEEVLVERSGHGTSESYHSVLLPGKYPVGSLVSVLFSGYRDTLLITE